MDTKDFLKLIEDEFGKMGPEEGLKFKFFVPIRRRKTKAKPKITKKAKAEKFKFMATKIELIPKIKK